MEGLSAQKLSSERLGHLPISAKVCQFWVENNRFDNMVLLFIFYKS